MRSCFLLFTCFLLFSFGAGAQITQLTVGTAALPEVFYDGKIDPAGGTIQVGHITNTATGNDIFMVKLNAANQVVWQKIIVNAGTDVAANVIICANGDYVVTGELVQGGATRGFVCRVNSTNGNIIWNYISTAPSSPSGDKFYNARETSNGNIVAVGVTNFAQNQTNSFMVLLNSFGTLQWSRVSTQAVSDEFRSVNQLPNGNLIVGGMYNAGGFYRLVIIEMNETTAAVVAQNQYTISTTIPGVPLTINSMWSLNIFIKNGAVILTGAVFQNFVGDSYPVAYVYDQTTKNLSGNIYYHSGIPNQGYYIYPIGAQDFILAYFSTNPTVSRFVSRITNNAIVYSRQVNGGSGASASLDVLNNNLLLSGWVNNATDQDAYKLFTTTSFPLISTPCNITSTNTLGMQASTLTAVAASPIPLVGANPVASATLTVANTSYTPAIICSCELIAVSAAPANTTVCGGTNASFSITASNTGTYQWQESTSGAGGPWNNITNGGVYSGATTSTLTLTGVTTGMNNYQYRAILINPCDNVTSAAAVLTVTTPVTPTISITASANPVCSGTTVTFTATALNGGSAPVYQWKKNNVNVGTNSPVYTTNTIANGDVITAVLTSNANCATANSATSNAITMTVNAGNIANVRYPTVFTGTNQPVQLNARNIGGLNFLWQPATGLNNATISNPVFSYNQDVEYRITITLAAGCIVVDTQLVKVQGLRDIFVPRAFSPNSNGVNDRLYPFLVGISKLNYFRIYNRWGNLIFETNSALPASGWDGKYKGKLQPSETYTWIAEGIDIDGMVIKRGGNTLLKR